ncbi:FtsX-like permease family protein [uncultured Campylobacter sp.]|uniref:ABC transporter permease n=1 Tax=uncultured Campylobacter sp. TaxID=218934 RepID=UPI0026193D6F|nr:FtsX-like permease family protein [uncultured Campylobacter sp.]
MVGNNGAFFRGAIFKSIINSGIRSFVIFVAIMLGSAVCAAFVNIYADIDKKVASELNSYGANLIVSPANLENSHMDEAALDAKFAKITALKSANKYLFGSANLGVNSGIIMGVNFSSLRDTMPFLDLKEGSFIGVDFDDKNALIGQDLAKLLGAKLGDSIEITPIGSNETSKVKIKGIVYDGQKEDGMLLISLPLAQKILNQPAQVNYAEAIVSGDFKQLSEISKSLSDGQMSFAPIGKVSKTQGIILNKIKLLMLLIGITILLITSVCINTSLSSILLSRIKEFALIRAIGASKQNLLHLILSEILTVCVAGSLAGVFVGYLLAILLGHLIFSSSVDFRLISLFAAVALSLIFALAASYYPIKKALNPNLANLLRE